MTPPSLPSALLLDLDGVLIDSYEVWFHLVNDAASTWRYTPITRDAFAGGWGRPVYQGTVAGCLNCAGG